MPAKDHAAWDIFMVLVRTPSRIAPVREHEYLPFARERTAIFHSPFDRAALSRDIIHRRSSMRPIRLSWLEWLAFPYWLLQAALLYTVLLYGGDPIGNPVFWVLAVTALAALVGHRNQSRLRRTVNRFLHRHCPDCNYDLSASHPQPPLDPQTLGINLGPRHCPECGALWPLVPPPIPPEPTPPPLPVGRTSKNVRSKS